jgi:hypothetical protein
LATYWRPARTITVRRATKSRTATAPRATRVIVRSRRSSVNHFVPRTVAELSCPRIRKRPLPSPHSWRVRFLAAALARRARGQLSVSASVSWVTGLAAFACGP